MAQQPDGLLHSYYWSSGISGNHKISFALKLNCFGLPLVKHVKPYYIF